MPEPWLPDWGRRTYVMGVINVTPDSFSGDGLYQSLDEVVARAERMVSEGADVLDVGGESTRPGATPVLLEEEIRRVIPAVEAIVTRVEVPISVDTMKAEVARQALAAGASIVNDVSGLRDPKMAKVAAAAGATIVLVHHGQAEGEPAAPCSRGAHGGTGAGSEGTRDLIDEILDDLGRQIEVATDAGIAPGAIIVDPGLGMGKGWRENFEIIRRLQAMRALNKPVLAGPSRKGMIGRVLGMEAGDRIEGSAALVTLCIANGADVVRVHDVGPMLRVARMTDAIVRQDAG